MIGAGPRDAHRSEQAPPVVRVAELDPLQALDDVDGLFPVRREVEVVGERDADRWAARAAGADVDDGEAARPLVVDIQRAHGPSRRDVVGYVPDSEVVDDREGTRVDHVDRTGRAVRHVHTGWNLTQRAWDDARQRFRLNVYRAGRT